MARFSLLHEAIGLKHHYGNAKNKMLLFLLVASWDELVLILWSL